MARCQLHRCDARKSLKSRANSILDGNGLATAFHRHHHTNESRHSPHLPPYVSHPPVFQYLIHHPLGIFPSKLNRWFCYIMLIYTVSLNIACFFVTLFQCSYVLPYLHLSHNCLTPPQTSKHLLGDIQIHRHSKMPQHQSNLLLSLRSKHLFRLRYFPLARQRSSKCTSIISPARYADVHV